MNEKYRDKTIGEIIDRQKEKLNGLIDRLIAIEPAPAKKGERWILMTVHCSETDLGEDISHILVSEKDVMDKSLDWVTPYGYEFTEHQEIVNYYVADNYLTQHYLEDLIVDFLFESSFTGYEQEGLQEILDDIDKSKEEIENGTAKLHSWEEVKKEFEEHGFEFEKKDPVQEAVWKEYIQDVCEYNRVCQQVEVRKLREALEAEE